MYHPPKILLAIPTVHRSTEAQLQPGRPFGKAGKHGRARTFVAEHCFLGLLGVPVAEGPGSAIEAEIICAVRYLAGGLFCAILVAAL